MTDKSLTPIEFIMYRTSNPFKEEKVIFTTLQELLQFVQSPEVEDIILSSNDAGFPTIEIYDTFRE